MKSSLNFYFSALGLLAGLSSWGTVQSGFHLIGLISKEKNSFLNDFLLSNYFLEGAFVGFGLGIVLHVRTSIWYHHSFVLVLTKMLLGALFGSFIGVFSFTIGYFFQILGIEIFLCRIFSWIILGLFFVVITEIFRLHSGFFGPRVISGGIGGLIGGVFFELLLLYQISGPNNLFGLTLVGFSISFLIGINENRVTSCALQILSGLQEGQKFLLDQNKFYVGYGTNNDLILAGYSEVHYRHAIITKINNEVFIHNLSSENNVLVNFRTIDHQQAMKKGDIIKIGTALMQYHEI